MSLVMRTTKKGTFSDCDGIDVMAIKSANHYAEETSFFGRDSLPSKLPFRALCYTGLLTQSFAANPLLAGQAYASA
jgi:hypothetical protein